MISHDYIPAGSNIFQVPLEATLVARSPIVSACTLQQQADDQHLVEEAHDDTPGAG